MRNTKYDASHFDGMGPYLTKVEREVLADLKERFPGELFSWQDVYPRNRRRKQVIKLINAGYLIQHDWRVSINPELKAYEPMPKRHRCPNKLRSAIEGDVQ